MMKAYMLRTFHAMLHRHLRLSEVDLQRSAKQARMQLCADQLIDESWETLRAQSIGKAPVRLRRM